MGRDLYVLRLCFKFDLEKIAKDFQQIGSQIGRWRQPILHGKMSSGFIIHTPESIDDLEKRLRPTLDSIYSLANWWLEPAPAIVKAKHGTIDPYQSRLAEGWRRISQARHAQYMPQRKAG